MTEEEYKWRAKANRLEDEVVQLRKKIMFWKVFTFGFGIVVMILTFIAR